LIAQLLGRLAPDDKVRVAKLVTAVDLDLDMLNLKRNIFELVGGIQEANA
jgi:hypothetical protein